jgi:hypothetical protein
VLGQKLVFSQIVVLTSNLGSLNGNFINFSRHLGCQIGLGKKVGLNGKLLMVGCRIYIDVKKHKKLLIPKFDGL